MLRLRRHERISVQNRLFGCNDTVPGPNFRGGSIYSICRCPLPGVGVSLKTDTPIPTSHLHTCGAKHFYIANRLRMTDDCFRRRDDGRTDRRTDIQQMPRYDLRCAASFTGVRARMPSIGVARILSGGALFPPKR